MDVNPTQLATLLVVHHRPADLLPLLPGAARVGLLDPITPDPSTGQLPAFEVLCVDGPLRVLALVMERRPQRPQLVPLALAPGGDSPLGWEVLDLAARRHETPALDLRPIRWHGAEGLWWTNGDGPVHLPLPVDTPRGAAATAAVLLATSNLAAESPLRRWLDHERTHHASDGRAWDVALCAGYLTAALTHLGRRRSSVGVRESCVDA